MMFTFVITINDYIDWFVKTNGRFPDVLQVSVLETAIGLGLIIQFWRDVEHLGIIGDIVTFMDQLML